MIGSSLLFVNDESQANIWMIDFAKTSRTESCNINLGSGENGYLTGLNNLISFIENGFEATPFYIDGVSQIKTNFLTSCQLI